MSEKTPEGFIYIHESVFQSVVRDAISVAFLVGAIGIGVLLDSAAMEWAGFVLFFLVIFGRATKIRRMSADEAREFLGMTTEAPEVKQ